MDWSATLSLTTSHARTHRANYGSFSAAAATPLKRHGSGSTISIPESIPEHQCVERFASPHLNYAELLEHFDVLGIASSAVSSVSSAVSSSSASYTSISSSKTLTLTETSSSEMTRLQTFKMLLTSPSSARINGGPPGGAPSARAASEDPFAPHDPHDPPGGAVASSYWLQERERMRLLRDKRHRARNGSPTKAATLRDDDDPEVSKYRTAALLCSVPLLLVIAFVVLVLVFGDGSAAVAAEAGGVAVLSANAAAAVSAPAAPTTHLRSGGGPQSPALAHRNP